MVKLWLGATDSRNCSTVTQSGNVTTGDVIAAETGMDRSMERTVEPASSAAPADRRNQPRKAVQIPLATLPRNSSRTPAAIIR